MDYHPINEHNLEEMRKQSTEWLLRVRYLGALDLAQLAEIVLRERGCGAA